jgi:hypothetical protein
MTKEKKWHNQIAKYTEKYGAVAGLQQHPIQHHHCVGRTYRENKILIGTYFVIPLPFYLHDVSSDDENNVTHYPRNFVRAFGKQSSLWWVMCQKIMANDWGELPFSDEVVKAIQTTNK